MAKKRGKKLRYVSFKKIPGVLVFSTFCFTLVVLAWTLINMFLPNYRTFYLWIAPPLSLVRVSVSLWKSYAHSNCLGPARIKDVCRKAVRFLDNTSLWNYSQTVCSIEAMLFYIADLGCSSSLMLRVGSGFLAGGFGFAAGAFTMVAFLIVAWWFTLRTLKMRKAAIFVAVIGCFFNIIGIMFYLLLSGVNVVRSDISNVSVFSLVGLDSANPAAAPTGDLDFGFFIAIAGVAFSLVLPVSVSGGLRKECCEDWEPDEDEEDRQELLEELEKAVNQPLLSQKPKPQYGNPSF